MSRLPSSHVVACLSLVAACLTAAASCTRNIYLVEQGDGSYVEAERPAAVEPPRAKVAAARAPSIGAPRVPSTPTAPRWREYETVVDATELDEQVLSVEVTPSHRSVARDGRSLFVEVTLTAIGAPSDAERPPLNLSIVIDRSGSMRGDKIANVRQAATWLVDHLEDGDHVTVVSYANDVRVDASARLDGDSRDVVRDAIAAITDNGGTNLGAGLTAGGDAALQLISDHGDDGPLQSRLVLLSDGKANKGVVDPGELGMMADVYHESDVSVTTMGVGLDYNEDLMEFLALNGGGNYYYIRDASDLAETFGGELDSLAQTTAADSRIDLELSDGVTLREVYGYRFERDGNLVRVQTDDVVIGRTRRLLLALDLPADHDGPLEVLTARAEFTDVTSGRRARLAIAPLSVDVTDDPEQVAASVAPHVVEKRERVLGALARRQAHSQLDAGNRDAALELVRQRQRELAESNRTLGSDVLTAEQAALDALAAELEALPTERNALRKKTKKSHFKDATKRDKHDAKGLLIY